MMKKTRKRSELQLCNWLALVKILLLSVMLSGCYLTDSSLHQQRNLTHPLPYQFFLYNDDESTGYGFSKMYVGQANGREFDVTSHDAIVSMSFEQFDRKNKIYWGLIHSVDEKGKETFFNLLAKIDRKKMQIYLPADGPKKFDTRAALLQAFADRKIFNSPTANYSIYDLGKSDQKARAEALVKAGEKENGDSAISLRKTQNIDLTRASWRKAGDKVRHKLTQVNSIDEKIQAYGFSKVEHTTLPFYNNTSLVRVSGTWEPESLALYFLYDGDALYHLNGMSPVIHEYNKSHAPVLNEDTAAAYLWYFGFFVRSEQQPFLVLNSSADTYYPKAANANLQNQLARSVKSPVCKQSEEADSFDCKVVILYSGALFQADMKVESSGMVSMSSDNPLHSGFPEVDAPVTVAATGDRFELKYHPRIDEVSALRTKIIKLGETPYLLANGVSNVPKKYLDDKGKVILNISDEATTGLVFTYDKLKFSARFSGKTHLIEIPLSAIEAVYSKETGDGLLLTDNADTQSQPATLPSPRPSTGEPATSQPAEPSRQVATSRWVHDSPVENGVRKHYLYNFASTALGNYANPFLRVECKSSGVNVVVMWGKPMKNMYPESSNQEAVRVDAKFGRSGWKTLAWALSGDRFVTYPPTAFNAVGSGVDSAIFSLLGMDSISKRNSAMFAWNARSFVNQLRSHDSLVLSAQDSSNREVKLNIDLAGYRELSQQHFAGRCR